MNKDNKITIILTDKSKENFLKYRLIKAKQVVNLSDTAMVNCILEELKV